MDHSHYYDADDRRFARVLREHAPAEFAAYTAFSEAATAREDGAVPRKYRELIAVAVALTTQCPYCIESHVKAAKQAGASEAEVAETVFVAGALRAGGAVAHGRMALRLMAESEG